MKKCVVIGSGLGGLSCGIILAKNGYKVTVLEQGDQIGGCLQCFRRGDTLFETGMHYIGSANKGETLYQILNYLGVYNKITLSELNPCGYDVVSFKGRHYRFANSKEAFINSFAEMFPQNRKELEEYYNLIQKVTAAQAMHSLSNSVDIDINTKYRLTSIEDVMKQRISNPLLREVLCAVNPLYAGEKDKTPFSLHSLIFDFYNKSAFRIVGGSSTLADALSNKIKELGGEVLTRHKVAKIECSGNIAKSVQTTEGERFEADLVICAIHPSLFVDMVDSTAVRSVYKNRIRCTKNTIGAFTVYLKFKKERVKYMNNNLFYYRGDSVWNTSYSKEEWPPHILYMHMCHKENPEWAESGQILTYMNFNEMLPWENTKIGQRGEEYKVFKKKRAEAAILALDEEVGGIAENIESYYTSTPLTYRDYTGIPEGSMYGAAKDVTAAAGGEISSKTPIENILLTGESITCHGMLGVLAGSLVTCSYIIPKEKLLEEIKNCS